MIYAPRYLHGTYIILYSISINLSQNMRPAHDRGQEIRVRRARAIPMEIVGSQVAQLYRSFCREPRASNLELKLIAEEVHLPFILVKDWFYNKRYDVKNGLFLVPEEFLDVVRQDDVDRVLQILARN